MHVKVCILVKNVDGQHSNAHKQNKHINAVYVWVTFYNHFLCSLGASELPSLFRSHYYRLCKAVSSQHAGITPLADILYGSGLLSDETRLAVQHTLGLPPYDRATKLLNPAVRVAQDSVENAQKFCACLQECGVPVPENILEGKIAVWLFFHFLHNAIWKSYVKQCANQA